MKTLILLMAIMPVWDQNQADYVLWQGQYTEVFVVSGKKYPGGFCEDMEKDGNGWKYYWRDKTGAIHETFVKHVFFDHGDYLEEILDYRLTQRHKSAILH